MATSTDSCDAIVIGAGIIGACTAYELAKTGWRTLNVDKLPAAGYGSTAASCAIVRTYYSTLPGSAIAYEGVFYWRDWPGYLGAEETDGLARYHNTGCVIVKTEANGYLENIRSIMDDLGVPYEDWDADTLRERFPIVDAHEFAPARRPDDPRFGKGTGRMLPGAVYFPDGGYVNDPQLAARNAQEAAARHGAEFLFNAEVTDILRADGRVTGVRLADGSEIAAPVVVNVAGPHSSRINEMAGIAGTTRITTRALRHEVAHVPSPAGFDFESAGYVFSDSDVAVYCRPETGNHILIGSEDPACDPQIWVDPDNYERDFTDQWTAQVYRMAQRFPDLGIPSRMKGVVDLYDVTEDWGPIYDRSDLPGFYLAIGTSGNQFKNGPVAGKMMATLIEACENGHDHDADPVRFHLEHVGRTIDLGFCSRNREINVNSSFSVIG